MAIPRVGLYLTPVIVILYGIFVFSVRGDYPRLQERLLKVPGLSSWIKDRQGAVLQGKLQALNHAAPSFLFLRQFVSHPQTQDGKNLADYIGYYKKLVEYFPENADAHALLAFCYYHAGQGDLAIEEFQQAHRLNPQSFWPLYNLAAMHYRLKQYDAAAGELEKALATNPNGNLNLTYRGALYHQIYWPDAKLEPEFLKGSLLESYQAAYLFLKLTYDQLGRKREADELWNKFLKAFQVPDSFTVNTNDFRVKIF